MLARRRSRASAEPAAGETAVVALERAQMVLVVLAPRYTAAGDVRVPPADHPGPSARAICLGIYPALGEPLGDICSDPRLRRAGMGLCGTDDAVLRSATRHCGLGTSGETSFLPAALANLLPSTFFFTSVVP